ncbi:NYN domain-containing protein [Trametes gibbosa]|nr:NYN domain-containing protein [Trametes gibbosa]
MLGMKDGFDEHVAIFWDYENCTPPCNVPGYDVVNNIRRVAHEYGSVKLFKAYLELSEQASSKSIGLRSELQSCGVSLTDCPHNGRKDVADKMMIVDMLTYAIDNPAPATIVLISGDRDFVYAVSVLCLRRYRVVVVAPYTAHNSLKSQASVVLDWEADIMGRTTLRPQVPGVYYDQAPTDDALHRSPRRPLMTFGGTLPSVTQKSNRRLSFKTVATGPVACQNVGAGGYGGTPHVQGRHLRSISAANADGASSFGPSSLVDRSLYRGIGHQAFVRQWVGDEAEEDEAAVDRRPIPDIVDVMGVLQENISRGTPLNSQFEIPPAADQVSLPSLGYTVPTVIQSQGAALPPPPSPSSIGDSITRASHVMGSLQGVLTPPPSSPTLEALQIITPPRLACGFAIVRPEIVEPRTRLASHPTPQTVSVDSPESPLGSLRLPFVGDAAIQREAADHTEPQDTTPALVVAEVYHPLPIAVTSSMESPKNPGQKVLAIPSPMPLHPVRVLDPITLSQDTPSLPIPEKYVTLVRAIQELKARGDARPLRSLIGLQIRQLDPNVFSKAGVTSFKQYTLDAESQGIVVLGGSQSYAWIALSPPYDV